VVCVRNIAPGRRMRMLGELGVIDIDPPGGYQERAA
jgi:hypothetical protein